MPKPMLDKIDTIDGDIRNAHFTRHINEKINEINTAIEFYNQLDDREESLKLLKMIHQKSKMICDEISSDHIKQIPQLRKILHLDLFYKLKSACAFYGIKMHDLSPIQNESTLTNAQKQLAMLIEDMSPEKLSIFLKMLDKNPKSYCLTCDINCEIHMLYTSAEKHEGEGALFEDFIQHHQVTFLAGKNSKNFKITRHDSEESFILKVENRRGTPKKIERRLRNHEQLFGQILTPVFADRQGSFVKYFQRRTRNLVLLPFCSEGDLQTYATKPQSNEDKAKDAIEIYIQMAAILKTLEDAQLFFPDMKNNNWLLDHQKKLYISDTKSFHHTDKNHTFNPRSLHNLRKWKQLFLSSDYMNPPEFDQAQNKISSSQAHSYMLGKNLYQFLTQCSNKYLTKHNHGEKYNFKHPIFQTSYGEYFKKIITRSIIHSSAERLSLEKIIAKLMKARDRLSSDEKKQTISSPVTLNYECDTEKMTRESRYSPSFFGETKSDSDCPNNAIIPIQNPADLIENQRSSAYF